MEEFGTRLMDNILALHRDLTAGTYRHGGYKAFKISDPKPRDIHKASVRDRLLHHAIYRILYPYFDQTFIFDSYSCRKGKGTHRAMDRFRTFTARVSKNHKRTCWVLKCDIRKFFASIDHAALLEILDTYIPDGRLRCMYREIIGSFSTSPEKGLPLGNLTSQLLVNVYMNEFDQFVKHKLKARYYIRYADDFVILSHDREWLSVLCRYIGIFLQNRLALELHPHKVSIRTAASGVDFLGWVHFPDHRVLRTSTKRRAFRNCRGKEMDDPTVQSYFGLMKHGNTRRLRQRLPML
ncbi:group II intron reverse transcriptase domain-containing protein [Candidatus Kaiserbacteria bacterium]|nr:group II intron reverse transcriptase domain-containing protein [Candidatus Kaiserbacteria bacterium]